MFPTEIIGAIGYLLFTALIIFCLVSLGYLDQKVIQSISRIDDRFMEIDRIYTELHEIRGNLIYLEDRLSGILDARDKTVKGLPNIEFH